MSKAQGNNQKEIASHADYADMAFKASYIKVIEADIESMERCIDERRGLLNKLTKNKYQASSNE